jgi:predicted amino acid-binding ACT domain protein
VITRDFKKKRNWKVNSKKSKKLLLKNKTKIYYQLQLKKKLRLLFNLTVFLVVHKTKTVNRSQFRECINLSRTIAEDQVNMVTLVELPVKMTLGIQFQESIHQDRTNLELRVQIKHRINLRVIRILQL